MVALHNENRFFLYQTSVFSDLGLLEPRLAQTFLPTRNEFELTGLHCF